MYNAVAGRPRAAQTGIQQSRARAFSATALSLLSTRDHYSCSSFAFFGLNLIFCAIFLKRHSTNISRVTRGCRKKSGYMQRFLMQVIRHDITCSRAREVVVLSKGWMRAIGATVSLRCIYNRWEAYSTCDSTDFVTENVRVK